jgi:excisionase family DNA binding protein
MTNAKNEVNGATPAGAQRAWDWRTRSANPAPERQTITLTELAKILGISRTTCYDLFHRRELPVRVVRVGRRLLVSKVEVRRFLEGGNQAISEGALPERR